MQRGRPSYFDLIKREYESLDDEMKDLFKMIRMLLAAVAPDREAQPAALEGKHPEKAVSGRDVMELMLAYVFFRLERAQMIALYLIACNYLLADTGLAAKAIDREHFTRDKIEGMLRTIFGKVPEKKVDDSFDLEEAEKARDKLMHGKNVSDRDIVSAICSVLSYCVAFRKWLDEQSKSDRSHGKLNPFTKDARSVMAGKIRRLGKRQSRFMLKGCGFALN